ncbi:hypothetical protein OKW27_006080 [Paraburkholderia sp. 35.1]
MNTATAPTHSTVTSAIHDSKLLPLTPCTAIGARFRPITQTIAPVTTGGISVSIQPVPTAATIRPITPYATPHAMMPPNATAIFGFAPCPP